MPVLSTENNRGKVCNALSTTDWKDYHHVTEELSWTPNGASKMLADVYRMGSVHRRESTGNHRTDSDYEYS